MYRIPISAYEYTLDLENVNPLFTRDYYQSILLTLQVDDLHTAGRRGYHSAAHSVDELVLTENKLRFGAMAL